MPGKTATSLAYRVTLHPGHPVFGGHFPGNPVLPGVCQVQLIREILGTHFQRKLRMVKADNIKYMNMISPVSVPEFNATVEWWSQEDGIIEASAVFSGGETVFLKFRGTFINDPEDAV
jgi:3-hydroxyacyl-[acyl-carrier-protein] dehydratase